MPWVKGQSGYPMGRPPGCHRQVSEPPELTTWTACGLQRTGRGPRWVSIDGAPLTYQQAKDLVASGHLFSATRVTDAGTEFVVKSRILSMQRHLKVA